MHCLVSFNHPPTYPPTHLPFIDGQALSLGALKEGKDASFVCIERAAFGVVGELGILLTDA